MDAFWTFSRQMFRKRATVAWALFFAVISAGGLGVGLLSLGPVLKLILDGETLPTLVFHTELIESKEFGLKKD